MTAPALAGDAVKTRRLASSVAIEIVIVAAILSVVALWRFTPPPRSLVAVPVAPATVHIHTDKAAAEITITPGRAGPVTIAVVLSTPDSVAAGGERSHPDCRQPRRRHRADPERRRLHRRRVDRRRCDAAGAGDLEGAGFGSRLRLRHDHPRRGCDHRTVTAGNPAAHVLNGRPARHPPFQRNTLTPHNSASGTSRCRGRTASGQGSSRAASGRGRRAGPPPGRRSAPSRRPRSFGSCRLAW